MAGFTEAKHLMVIRHYLHGVGAGWSVVSGGGQWSVVSGQWSVVGGQWSVAGGQWSVVSGGGAACMQVHYVVCIRLL